MAFTNKIKEDFTIIPNSAIKDLSLSELGVLNILASKPTGWEFSSNRIAIEGKSSKRTVDGILKSLEAKGYLERRKLNTGKMEYVLIYPPCSSSKVQKPHIAEFAKCENCKVQKPQSAEFAPISNTIKESNTIGESNTIKETNINVSKEKIKIIASKEATKTNNFKKLTLNEFKTQVNSFDEFSLISENFIDYWTEKSATGIMKFQLQKTWDTKLRLKTWLNRSKFEKVESSSSLEEWKRNAI